MSLSMCTCPKSRTVVYVGQKRGRAHSNATHRSCAEENNLMLALLCCMDLRLVPLYFNVF